MRPARNEIKIWVKSKGKEGRQWLAQQCGVAKRTVDNWLSGQEIPEASRALIGRLMQDDEKAEAERKQREAKPVLQNLVVEVELAEFTRWNQAAMARGKLIHDWVLDAIREAYKADQEQTLE